MKNNCLLSLVCCLLLTACGGGQNARDILGLGRNAPDEFRVVSRPPLSVPPDFALRPPLEGVDDYTGLPAADSAARAVVTGEEEADLLGSKRMMGEAETAVGIVRSYELESQADDTFLSNIGAEKADETIRQKLDSETLALEKAKEEKDEEFLGWLKPEKDESAVVVDPKKEKKRIEKNKAKGKKINEGEVPVKDSKPKSVLESIF